MIIHAHKDGKLAYTGIWRLAKHRFNFATTMKAALLHHKRIIFGDYTMTYRWEDSCEFY